MTRARVWLQVVRRPVERDGERTAAAVAQCDDVGVPPLDQGLRLGEAGPAAQREHDRRLTVDAGGQAPHGAGAAPQ